MTWALLVIVALMVAWLRFDVENRIRLGLLDLVEAILVEHGTKTLFNGQSAKYVMRNPPGRPNRAQRRAHSCQKGKKQ